MYDAKFMADERANARRGYEALIKLLAAFDAIDAVDDVRLGFLEPADERRVQAARKILAAGLKDCLKSARHCMDLSAGGAEGPDPEHVIPYLSTALAALAPLATTATRAVARLGKLPSRGRRTEGARLWRARWRAERAAREGVAA